MAKKEVTPEDKLTAPVAPGPDATEAEMREFEDAKREYEEQRHELQQEAAEKSPQVQQAESIGN